MKSSAQLRVVAQIDAAIDYASQTLGKSRRDLRADDFRKARQHAEQTNHRGLLTTLDRLAMFDELVNAIRDEPVHSHESEAVKN